MAKKVTKSKKTQSVPVQTPEPASTAPQKPILHIFGESPLAEEFATLCNEKGYEVRVTFNTDYYNRETASLPFKISGSIAPETILGIELTNIDISKKKENLVALSKALPITAPILSSAITITATEQSIWIDGKHRLLGIAALPTIFDKPLVEVAPTIYTPKETVDAASRFFGTLQKNIELVQDRVGMVLPRILCQTINEAVFAVTEDIASPQDIDTAMKLGMNFPFGPIEWADRIGLKQVFAVVDALHRDLQEERYRPAPLLRQMALTGEWWNRVQQGETKS